MFGTGTLLRTLLLWAMLPLTVLSGSPRFLCLCSNGEIKAFCDGPSSPRSCCPRPIPKAVRAGCQPGCCASHRKAREGESSCAAATCRCTQLVALPDVPTKPVLATLPDVELNYSPAGELPLTSLGATPAVVLIGDSPPRLAGREMLTALDRWQV